MMRQILVSKFSLASTTPALTDRVFAAIPSIEWAAGRPIFTVKAESLAGLADEPELIAGSSDKGVFVPVVRISTVSQIGLALSLGGLVRKAGLDLRAKTALILFNVAAGIDDESKSTVTYGVALA